MGVGPPPTRDFCPSIDSEAAADAFFDAAPPAPGLEAVRGSVGAFLAHHGYRPDLPGRGARPIALVTSGGTTAPSSDPRFDLWTISAADPAAPRPWSTSSREATRASSSIGREASARSSAPFRASRPRAASACAAGAKTASSASSAPRATTPSLPRTPPNPPQPVTSRLGSRQCRPRRPSSRPS